MKISTKGRYALRVMLDLAINNTGEYIPLKEISERQGITVKYMEQIIPLLKRAGFLKSTRGNNGGYKLSLRSNGKVNVSKIAVAFGGGGHVMAAGADMKESPEEIIRLLCDSVREQLETPDQ